MVLSKMFPLIFLIQSYYFRAEGFGEGSILGGGWVKAEGEAVEMRAVNSVSVGLRLCLVLFFSLKKKKISIGQLPFSTSLFVTVELL